MNEKQLLLINFIALKFGRNPSDIRPDYIIGYYTDDIITDFAITHEIALTRMQESRSRTVKDLLEQLA